MSAAYDKMDGLVASCRKNPDAGREEVLPAKVAGIPFRAGELIEFREPNAAGYGDPLERDPEQVREAVLGDFTTVELARDAYGAVVADERTLELDLEATEARDAAREPRRPLADRVLRAARAAAAEPADVGRRQPRVRDRMTLELAPDEAARADGASKRPAGVTAGVAA